MTAFWSSINEPTLHQGDLLTDCLIPEFTETFGDSIAESNTIYTDQADLIVLSQTCDLAHGKLSLAALCPVWTVPAFEEAQSAPGQTRSAKWWRDYWNNVRKGRSATLHLLASPIEPTEARSSLVVDFRAINTHDPLYETLQGHMRRTGERLKLKGFDVPTTVENLAFKLFSEITEMGLRLDRLEVRETDSSVVVYTREDWINDNRNLTRLRAKPISADRTAAP